LIKAQFLQLPQRHLNLLLQLWSVTHLKQHKFSLYFLCSMAHQDKILIYIHTQVTYLSNWHLSRKLLKKLPWSHSNCTSISFEKTSSESILKESLYKTKDSRWKSILSNTYSKIIYKSKNVFTSGKETVTVVSKQCYALLCRYMILILLYSINLFMWDLSFIRCNGVQFISNSGEKLSSEWSEKSINRTFLFLYVIFLSNVIPIYNTGFQNILIKYTDQCKKLVNFTDNLTLENTP
jgi:hypothetical protein